MLIARSTEIHELPSICYCKADQGDMFSLSESINAQ